MRRTIACISCVVVLTLLVNPGPVQAARHAVEVANQDGETIKVVDENGHPLATHRPDGSPVYPGQGALSVIEMAASPPVASPRFVVTVHENVEAGILVDENGHVTSTSPHGIGEPDASADSAAVVDRVVIDRMETSGGYITTYYPYGGITLIGSAETYFLSDGSSWESGAGSYRLTEVSLDRVEVSGDTVRYVLRPPTDGVIYQQTDYNGGDHSAQGTLGASGELVLEATIGSTTAVVRGAAEILSNEMTSYGEPRFNFYASVVGSVVPFEITYTRTDGTWEADTFDGQFRYRQIGVVDFASPISVPQLVSVEITGSAQIPDDSSAQYFAVARYDNDILREVTDDARWDVQPAALASIDRGLLTTQSIETSEEVLTVFVEYTEGDATVQAEKTVICKQGGMADIPNAWQMYQADSRHSGHAPILVEPDEFSLRWQRTVAAGMSLNPVTAADGKVFVSLNVYFDEIPSLFVLDARDGETMWSKNFGGAFSVNPPSYAYGNVYIQTGNHGSDTYLHSFDAETGSRVFQAPHSAQWERYYSPTIHDGAVFVNGGYYGGMYAFNAFSGEQLWFHSLPQYDEWTPAVEDLAYAYVGGGLYALDRDTGERLYVIPDPNFDWQGWSMRLAPVLGELNDAVVIHDGRLIIFDLQSQSIRRELQDDFHDQPSVVDGTIYAMNRSQLVALDEMTGDLRWSWVPPQGYLQGNLVVTDSHVFASTDTQVYAVEILSRDDVWSYPEGGHLTLANETLYIASDNGTLTAIAMPEFIPSPVVDLEISGPDTVPENFSAQFTATAHYEDGRIRDRTGLTEWTVAPAMYASMDSDGLMTTTELFEPAQTVLVRAEYTEDGVTVTDEVEVQLVIGVSIEAFIERNITGAMEIQQQVLAQLETALLRENAARAVLSEQFHDLSLDARERHTSRITQNHVDHAIFWTEWSVNGATRSVDALIRALQVSRQEPLMREIGVAGP